jgi:hypothetical protein
MAALLQLVTGAAPSISSISVEQVAAAARGVSVARVGGASQPICATKIDRAVRE